MKINLQSKSYYIISVLVFLAISCKVVKQQENTLSYRDYSSREVVTIPHYNNQKIYIKMYYIDSITQIGISGSDNKFDTFIVPFTPIKDRNNWLNDTVRLLPTINGEDVLDTIRPYKK